VSWRNVFSDRTEAVFESIDERRDHWWRREATRQIESIYAAKRFIEEVGFASCMTDARRPGPSLYLAVCGRRDAVMPSNVQKDPESSQTWVLKGELLARGNVYYAKLARGKATFRTTPLFGWNMRAIELPRESSGLSTANGTKTARCPANTSDR
jgi:hypothetical protein